MNRPTGAPRARSGLAVGAGVFLLLAGAYFAAGLRLLDGPIYDADAFDADARRVVHDIGRVGGTHYRSKVHPLFVLLVNPPGNLVKAVVGRPRRAALALDAAAGAAAVLLLHGLLVRMGVARRRAVLWTLLFATSASQVFFSIVPETYAFSAASLLLLFRSFARDRPAWPGRTAAAVLSFGVTVTNLVAAFALALSSAGGERIARRVGRAFAFAGVVVLAAAALSLLQRVLYPETELFFLKSSFTEEASYVFRPATLGDVVDRTVGVGRHLLFANLAAPRIEAVRTPVEPPVARFGPPRAAGWLHAVLWSAVCVIAAAALARRSGVARGVLGALLAWIAFNAALHLVYGQVLFLYSCGWTFAVVAVAAVGLEPTASGRWQAVASAALILLILLQVVANGSFVAELYALYG